MRQKIALDLRKSGIKTEIMLVDSPKLIKQLNFANKNKIPFVVIFGDDEIKKNQVKIKKLVFDSNMKEEDMIVSTDQLSDKLKENDKN